MSQRTCSGTIPNPTALFGTWLFQPTDPSEFHFPSGHCISDSPWLLSPLLVAAFWSPNLSPEGHRYLLTSHTSERGWHWCHVGVPVCSQVGIRTLQQQLKEKKTNFPRAWANKLHLSQCFRGLLKILPLACWKTTRKTESFLPLLVQYVYIYIVWNIYIYIVLQLVFPCVHSNKLCCYFEAF